MPYRLRSKISFLVQGDGGWGSNTPSGAEKASTSGVIIKNNIWSGLRIGEVAGETQNSVTTWGQANDPT